MSGSTPVYGLPYQDPLDPPNGPTLGQDIAEAVEAALLEALGRKGYVGQHDRNTTSPGAGSITTTETQVQAYTFDAVAGQRYKITAVQGVQQDASGGSARIKLRWASGTSVSTSSTLIGSIVGPCNTANVGSINTFHGTFVAPSTGQMTVGVFMMRNTGTGGVISFGNADQTNTILVEGV